MEAGRDRVDRDRCKLGLIESRRDCDVIKITNTDHQTPVMDRELSVVSQLITPIIPGLLSLRFYLYLYFIFAKFLRKMNISINVFKVTTGPTSAFACGGTIIDDQWIISSTKHCCVSAKNKIEALIGGGNWIEGANSQACSS